jgi:predicted enzyme related to lactoylglutathione lyase
MLQLTSLMIGSKAPLILAAFYEKVLETPPSMTEGEWRGFQVGTVHLTIGPHSEVADTAKEPARIMFNLETEAVEAEFERIKTLGARVIKEPYEIDGMWVATLADPDGNYFQLVTPWEE